MSDEREDLADWLLHLQVQNETSVAANDPVIRTHIEKLKAWRALVFSPAATPTPDADEMVAVRTIQAMDGTADMDAKFLKDHLDSVPRIEWSDTIKAFRRQIIAVAAETATLVSRPDRGGAA